MPDVMPPSASSSLQVHYELRLQETTASAGYCACLPVDAPDWNGALIYLKEHPLDDFMRTYLLGQIRGFEPQRLSALIETTPAEETVLRALWYEACLLFESFFDLIPLFKASEHEVLASATGLVYIKASLAADHGVHQSWMPLVHANHYDHQLLPDPKTRDLQHPFTSAMLQELNKVPYHLAEVVAALEAQHTPTATLPPPEETAAKALEKLDQAGVLAGEEMRHVASLSLYGLLRKWRFCFPVRCGRHAFEFSGTQTAYGRGLSLEAARASYAMEIVERCSAFGGFGPNGPEGYAQAYPLVNATYKELQVQGRQALDPNTLPLEAPYSDDRLYWMQGQLRTTDGMESILIPCQCIFLFSNLDEVSLFSGLGSTGLASGNTMAEAKLSALLELIERDGEATNPYHPSRCFLIGAEDPQIASLLEDYWLRGIHMIFQDISPPYGVPCCKCFVVGLDGQIAKGAGAHLDGQRAVLSALTETPYPYPYGPPSKPVPHDLPVLRFEALPNFSSGKPEQDLMCLENTLIANNLRPLYVDLTRSDLNLPVVRAIVPGLELMTDFDRFARVSPRYFANYLSIFTNDS